MKKQQRDNAQVRQDSVEFSKLAGILSSPAKPKSQRKPMPIIRYLVYLIIITITITGISLSRFATLTATDNAARVANFSVSVSPYGWINDDKSAHVTGGKVSYTLLVKNDSEVAVRARLVYASSGAPILPVTVANSLWETVSSDPNGWFTLSPKGTSGDTMYVVTSFSDTVGNGTGTQYKMRIEYEQID